MAIKVLITERHTLMRQGLRALVEKETDLEVAGEADDGQHALDLVDRLLPDVVVIDIGSRGLDGVEPLKSLAEKTDCHIVALSDHADRDGVERILDAGAKGYLLTDCAIGELAEAIRAVNAGEVYLSNRVASVVVEDYVMHINGRGRSASATLTPRELQVLRLLAEGKCTKEIAHGFDISVKTVETHRHNIKEKLGIDRLAGLIKYAVRNGLTSLEV